MFVTWNLKTTGREEEGCPGRGTCKGQCVSDQREGQGGPPERVRGRGQEVRGWQGSVTKGHGDPREELDFVSRAMGGPLKGIQQERNGMAV